MRYRPNSYRANEIIAASFEIYPEVEEDDDNFDLYIFQRTAFFCGAEWVDALPGLYCWNDFYEDEPQRGRILLVHTEASVLRLAVWNGQNDDWRYWALKWDIIEWRYLDRIDNNDYEEKTLMGMRLKKRLLDIDEAANKKYPGTDEDFDAPCVEAFKIGAKWAFETPNVISAEEWRSATEEPQRGKELLVVTKGYEQKLAVWDGQYKRWNSFVRKWNIVKWQYLYPIEGAKSLMRYNSLNRHAESEEVSKDEYPDSQAEQIAFKAGVDWADEHLAGHWHNASEEPARDKTILVYRNTVECIRKYYDYDLTKWNGKKHTWEQFAKEYGIISWMYIKYRNFPDTDELPF